MIGSNNISLFLALISKCQVPKRYSERAKKVFYAEYEDDF